MMNPNKKWRQLLIVEDEPTDALLLLKALKSHLADARIEHASTGTDALNYLTGGEICANRDQLPQLILMDLKLPGISGFELLATVKTMDNLKEITIVVLTSSSESKDVCMPGLNGLELLEAIGYDSNLSPPTAFVCSSCLPPPDTQAAIEAMGDTLVTKDELLQKDVLQDLLSSRKTTDSDRDRFVSTQQKKTTNLD